MKSLAITGYKNFELGIFKRNSLEVIYIKAAIRKHLESFIKEGLEWVVISGQLGIELWAAETVYELKVAGAEVKLALLEPFTTQNYRWNENNQLWYKEVLGYVDYHQYITNRPYESPQQFQLRDEFIIDHTDGALFVYDLEKEGSPKFFYQRALEKRQSGYQVILVDFYELQNIAEEMNASF